MSTTVTTDTLASTTQVYRVYIKATAEAIWQAITDPEWSARYGYGGAVNYDLRPGGALTVNPSDEMRAQSAAMGHEIPDVIIDGEVIEADPPHKLVSTWRMLMDPGMAAEGFTRLTHEIKPLKGGYCSLTLIHELDGAPNLAAVVGGQQEEFGAGGGHAWVLSDLKTLLETGAGLAG
jgi:uncharacterized protein YndB with AHSA1/START domain